MEEERQTVDNGVGVTFHPVLVVDFTLVLTARD